MDRHTVEIAGFLKIRVPFCGPQGKDDSIFETILGFPYFERLPFKILLGLRVLLYHIS